MEIKEKKKQKRERWAIIGALVVAFFTFNLLASRHFARIDLTDQNIYTLAPSTKETLKNLEDIVTLKLYFTPDMPPALQGLRRDVEDMLSEFKTYSDHHLRVEYHNPQESAVEEQKVQMLGIPPIEVTVIEKDKQALAKIYLGMSVHFGPKQEILPVVQNANNLEYRLAAAILKVTQKKETVIGWWGPKELPSEEDPIRESQASSYSLLLEQLRQRFQIESVDPTKLDQLTASEIPTLLFIVPEILTTDELEVFQNYLNGGGKAIVLAAPVSVALSGGLRPMLRENPLQKILKDYGVTIRQDLVVDRSNAMATFSGGVVNYHLPYPYWVLVRPEGFDRKEPMVSELNSLVLPWVSSIQLDGTLPEGITATSLIYSTTYAVRTSINTAASLDPNNAREAIESDKAEKTLLGVKLHKKTENNAEAQLLVVGNSAFLQNTFLQQFPENAVFIENALDVFSTGNALLGVRSKGMTMRPLALTSDGARTWIKMINMVAAPILLLGLGFWILMQRRRRAKELQLLFGKAS